MLRKTSKYKKNLNKKLKIILKDYLAEIGLIRVLIQVK